MFTRKGFTLVELAIVMTIIGLLIGGILKGQELLENARVTSTIAQIKSYDAAVTAFRDIYGALPGDLPNAGNKIPGCNENCTPAAIDASGWGAGDGIVGTFSGDGSVIGTQNPPVPAQSESWLMWVHLLKGNLVSGVTDAGIHGIIQRSFGVTEPAAKVGGGFWAENGRNISGTVPVSMSGLTLVLDTPAPRNISDIPEDAIPNSGVMIPSRAAQLDRKMDDGRPSAGAVKAMGNRSGFCTTSDDAYAESASSKDCSLLIGIQQ